MTEEQQDEPDSPSTQPDLTTIQNHDDSPYIVNEVLKELNARKLPVTDKVENWLEHAVKENEGGSHNAESSSLQSGYPILPQSTPQQLYPMQPQYQSTSVQYHPDPLPVTKETERTTTTTTCDNETLIDQSTSCDVDPLSITTCCNETLGQSSSQVNPVLIIDEQKTATKRKLKRDPGLLSQAEIEGIERDGNHLLNLWMMVSRS